MCSPFCLTRQRNQNHYTVHASNKLMFQSRVRLICTFLLTPWFSVTPNEDFSILFQHVGVHICADALGGQSGQLLWSWVRWVLGIGLKSFTRAICSQLLSHLSSFYHQNIFSILEIYLLNPFINEYFSLKFYWMYFNYLFKTLIICSDISFLEKYLRHWFVNPRCCLT